MENNISQASALEVAITLMKQKHTKQNIRKLINEVLEIMGLDDDDKTISTKLYIDIQTSALFVYMGNEEWDLKERQSLEEWDKDGSAFNSKDEIVEEDEDDFEFDEEFEDIDEDDFEDDEDDEDEEDEDDDYEDDEDDMYDDDELDLETDENGDTLDRYSEDDFDEDKYNNLMDDFEDMYEN